MPEPDSHALRAAWEPYLPGDMALQGSILMPYIPTVPCRLCPNVGKRARPILLHSRQVCYPFLLVLVSRKPSRYCWPTSFKVLGVLFLGEVCSAFLPSKKACWAYQFRYLGVGQQYPPVICTRDERGNAAGITCTETQYTKCAASQHEQERESERSSPGSLTYPVHTGLSLPVMARRP